VQHLHMNGSLLGRLTLTGLASLTLIGCSDATSSVQETAAVPACAGKCDALGGGLSALPVAVQSTSWDGYVVFGTPSGEAGGCRAMTVRPQLIDVSAHAVTFPPAAFSAGVDCPTELGGHAVVAAPGVERNPYPSDASGAFAEDGDHVTYQLLIYGSEDPNAPGRLAVREAEVVVANPFTTQSEVAALQVTGPRALSAGGDALHGIAPSLTADGGLLVYQGHPFDTDRTDTIVYSRLENPNAELGEGWTAPRSITELATEAEVSIDGAPLMSHYPLAGARLRLPDGFMYPIGMLFHGSYPWISRDGTELFFTTPGESGEQGAVAVIGRATGYAVRHIDGSINPSRNGMSDATRQYLSSPGSTPGFWAPYADTAPVLPLERRGPVISLFGGVTEGPEPFGTYNEVDFTPFADLDYLLYMPMNESLSPTAEGLVTYDPTQTADLSGNYQIGHLENGARFAVEQVEAMTDSLLGSCPAEAAITGAGNQRACRDTQTNETVAAECCAAQCEGADWRQQANGTFCAYVDGAPEGARVGQFAPRMCCELELPSLDDNAGAVGRAIYFSEQGQVRVPPAWALSTAPVRLTVEAFVQRLEDLDVDDGDHWRYLLQWPGTAELVLEEDGTIQATVFAGGEERRSGPVGPALEIGAWTHVAFTYEAVTGNLHVYVDGQLQAEAAFSPGLLAAPQGDLLLGPAGQGEALNLEDEVAILALDEVAISRVIRSADEIARAAGTYVAPAPPALANQSLLSLVDLPLGLDPSELLVPATNPTTQDAVELGRMLFFEPRLSSTGTISCGTCHNPEFAWTDGLALGVGVNGQVLSLNTPTILNRAFSNAQFFDGRAATMEEQAVGPIAAAAEMGFSEDEAIAFLESIPEYFDRFQAVYGTGPTADTIGRAIASFERTVFSGNSAVDQFEAGDLAALTEAELRGRALFHGKARCVACHNGTNYTNEDYHRTGLVEESPANLGRFLTTGQVRHLFAFKTPTLRNIAETGPYFHNGSVETLEEVVTLYNEGSSMPGHDWEIRPLRLTDAEEADLVSFLRALSDPNVTDVELPELPELPEG
jgi:cytochrome c peroxidase